MHEAGDQARRRERGDLRVLAAELRSMARGTPIRIHMADGPKTVTFLEMKRTRFIFEDGDGPLYSIPVGAFLGVADGEIPKRFLHAKETRMLHQACQHNDLAEIEHLVADGADINARSHENDGGRVPLEDAIEYGQLDAVRLLLAKGAQVNVRNRCGGTPLKLAVIMGNETIVQELLDKGADVSVRDYYGTPGDWARRFHRNTIADMLEKVVNHKA